MDDPKNASREKMKSYTLERLSMMEQNKGPEVRVNGVAPLSYEKLGNGYTSHTYSNLDLPPVPSMKEDTPPPVPSNPPRLLQPQQPRGGSRPSSGRSQQKFIPEHEIEIPADGSLYGFSLDEMSTFLRYMGVEERIVTHVHKKGLDGVKFSKFKDNDLEVLGMKNPIICHFRDKSIPKAKKKGPFMIL